MSRWYRHAREQWWFTKGNEEKLEQRHCSNLGTFSTVVVNGILFSHGDMVASVHGGMVGAVDSETCCFFFCFVFLQLAWDKETIANKSIMVV